MPEGNPSSGGLTPEDAAIETLQTGLHHLCESVELAFLKNVYGGLLLSSGGLMALVLATGFPEYTDNNPGLMRLLQGSAFPVGLIIVYFLGAELYTGYPMWLSMAAFDRKGFALEYFRATFVALIGNFVGAIWWAGMQSYLTGTLNEEPWRSQIAEQVDSDITDQHWHVIFFRAIGCGFLVTIAMVFGTQNRDGISKALGLQLPFFISTVAKFPHTVEYMYLGTTGMMLGSRMTIAMFLWKCMLPIILGNSIGGAFTGAYNYWVFIKRADDKERSNNRDWLRTDGE